MQYKQAKELMIEMNSDLSSQHLFKTLCRLQRIEFDSDTSVTRLQMKYYELLYNRKNHVSQGLRSKVEKNIKMDRDLKEPH